MFDDLRTLLGFSVPKPHFDPKRSRPVAPKVYGSDLVALVGFHDRGFVIARLAEPAAPWLSERIGTIPTKLGGTHTNIADGLRKAAALLGQTSPGILRRIWLLTDGEDNLERDALWPVVNEAAQLRCNINTIGFGDPGNYNEQRLREISGRTHNGRFVPVDTLRGLVSAFCDGGAASRRVHRAEATVLLIDCSLSMNEPMEGRRRIKVVHDALVQLLYYKQRMFS